MTKEIKEACVSEDKHKKKAFLYKPFEGKRQAWIAMIQNLINKNTNGELTSALSRMSDAEEIPIKWNKINKPKFMNFMKHIMENQEDYARDVKLWDLVQRDLKEKQSNKTREDKNKLMNDEKVLTPIIVTKSIAVMPIVEVTTAKPLVLPKKSQKKGKEEKVLAPVTITKPVDVPVVKATPAKPAVLPKPQKSPNSKTKKQTEWTTIIKNLIQTNTNEELTSALQKLTTAENIPDIKKWHEIKKGKFENFLINIPGYEVNPVIDEQLRIMISKARQEQKFKEKSDKYLTKGYPAKPIQNDRNSEWFNMFTSLVKETVGSMSKELPSDACQRISQHGEIPKQFYGIKNPDFKKFLKNSLDCEVNSKIADQFWDLISKALEEQRANKAKILAKKKLANKAKATKRKNDIENEKPAVNETSVKKIKEEVESKSLNGGSCDPVKSTSTVCKGAQHLIKVKWNTIGKTILRAQETNEMSLKKFQKKIVAEYLKKTGNADSAESVEVLWCKCQKKLSKNSKFQIGADTIKLFS